MPARGPDEWKALGERVRLLGRELFVVDLPAGPGPAKPPVLLIHGFPTCGWDWARIVDTLGAGRRLLIPDLLGFGHSEKPRGPYTIAEQADLVLALVHARGLGATELDLITHDMGDTVGCEILARRRAFPGGPRLRRVAMLNGGLLPELHRPALVQKLLRSPLGDTVAKLMDRKRFGKSFRAIFGPGTKPTERELDEHFALVARDGGILNTPQLLGYLPERRQHRARWVGAIVGLDLPLRLVWGDADPIGVWDIAREVQRLRPATDVVRLEGIGHYPQLEAPERVAQALVEFLA